MSKFHSTISRRDFMKAVGLVGAGVGAAAATAPVFHDPDELIGSSISTPYYDWWVSERDHYDPTVPVDWDMKWQVDGRNAREYRNPDGDWYFNAYDPSNCGQYTDYQNEYNPEFKWCNALRKSLDAASRERGGIDRNSFLGRVDSQTTPEDGGWPKWSGSPEENLRHLRGIVRFLGGDDVGALEHDSKCDRILTSYDMSGYKINFVSDTEPSETSSPKARNIPNSYKWCFSWTLRQPFDLTRRQEGGCMRGDPDLNPCGVAENASVWMAYTRLAQVEHQIQAWLRAMGYRGVAGGMNAITSGTAVATMSGRLEHARMGQIAIHPRWGATVRGTYKMFTNLPLAPTKPIDAGIYEFCKTCGICAELCPGQIIQHGKPTWTTGRNPLDGDDGDPLPYQAQGFEGWRTDIGKCPHCPVCQGTCPFNEMWNASWVHSFVKATVAKTSIFNGFFTAMDKSFDYGHKWEQDYFDVWDKHPTYGMNTGRTF